MSIYQILYLEPPQEWGIGLMGACGSGTCRPTRKLIVCVEQPIELCTKGRQGRRTEWATTMQRWGGAQMGYTLNSKYITAL